MQFRIKKTGFQPKVDKDYLISTILEEPASSLKLIKRKKFFIKSLINGHTAIQARTEAGLSSSQTAKEIISSPLGKAMLNILIDKEFTDKKIKNKLKEFWNAEEIGVTERGEIYSKKDYNTQMKAFDRVSKLRGYGTVNEDSSVQRAPTQVLFQVVNELKED